MRCRRALETRQFGIMNNRHELDAYWVIRLLVSLSVLFSVPTVGHAELQLETLQTAEGLLSVLPGKGSDCFSCKGLFLNGKQLLHNQHVFINGVFLSIKEPKLVSISSDGGGNCCPPTFYLLDFSRKPHFDDKRCGIHRLHCQNSRWSSIYTVSRSKRTRR